MKNLIFTKISGLKRKIASLFVLFFVLSSNASCAVGTIVGLGVLPVLGGIFGAKAAGAKETLAHAQRAMTFLEIFLAVASCLIVIKLVYSFFKMVARKRRNREFKSVITLLSRLQAELAFAKAGRYASTKELLAQISKKIEEKFIVKRIDAHLREQIIDSLQLMQRGELSLDQQMMFVDQWLRSFAFMVK